MLNVLKDEPNPVSIPSALGYISPPPIPCELVHIHIPETNSTFKDVCINLKCIPDLWTMSKAPIEENLMLKPVYECMGKTDMNVSDDQMKPKKVHLKKVLWVRKL